MVESPSAGTSVAMPSESSMVDIFMVKVEGEGGSSGDCVCMWGRREEREEKSVGVKKKRNEHDARRINLSSTIGSPMWEPALGKDSLLLHGTMH